MNAYVKNRKKIAKQTAKCLALDSQEYDRIKKTRIFVPMNLTTLNNINNNNNNNSNYSSSSFSSSYYYLRELCLLVKFYKELLMTLN